MVSITKKQRQLIAIKTNNRCGYCGDDLESRWHVDHIDPVFRNSGNNNEMERPENHCIANMMASCISCNLKKSTFTVEQFRHNISNTIKVLERNNPTYLIARRYGMIVETKRDVKFYFEELQDDDA